MKHLVQGSHYLKCCSTSVWVAHRLCKPYLCYLHEVDGDAGGHVPWSQLASNQYAGAHMMEGQVSVLQTMAEPPPMHCCPEADTPTHYIAVWDLRLDFMRYRSYRIF